MTKKTPLYEEHLKAEGKLVPFAGYFLPIQYKATGVIKEHLAVRNQAGIFDVSHMGELRIYGKEALANLQYILTNDFTNLAVGRIRYTLMCAKDGGVLDDLLVYRCGEEDYLLVVNAANLKKDREWIEAHLFGEVTMKDCSRETGQIALQGPRAQDILRDVTKAVLPEKYYSFAQDVVINEIPCLVSRTGYTGEDGFELYCADQDTPKLWRTLLAAGESYGLIPCGLGARDTLRLEAGMPLYGHELSLAITPFEAGLDFAVKLEKTDFIGKDALVNLVDSEGMRHRIGIQLIERGIVREGAPVYYGEEKIGVVTSGTFCPYLKQACAMALVTKTLNPQTSVTAEVRGKSLAAVVTALPFIKK